MALDRVEQDRVAAVEALLNAGELQVRVDLDVGLEQQSVVAQPVDGRRQRAQIGCAAVAPIRRSSFRARDRVGDGHAHHDTPLLRVLDRCSDQNVPGSRQRWPPASPAAPGRSQPHLNGTSIASSDRFSTPVDYPWRRGGSQRCRCRDTQITVVELKGSLAAIGLPAIVQLIGELHHSGTLELSKNSGAHGILGFDDGRLVSAEFEVEHGMSALETCVHELADANFRFVEGVAAGEHTLDIPAPELQRLIVRAANGEPLTEPPAAISGDELRAAGVCPRLGFADDPARHYSRPTALHRCYASESPSLVTNQEQLDLCLGGLYPTCARFRNASRSKSLAAPAALPPRDDRDAEERAKANVRADSARVAAADHSTPGADRTTPARVSQQHRAATDTHDDDAPSGAARLRNVIGGLAAGRGLAALVGLIGGGAPTRQPASNPAAAALVTATAAPPASVAAAQATALAAIGAAQTTALAPAAAAQPTAAAAQTSAAAQAAAQSTGAAPTVAAQPAAAAAQASAATQATGAAPAAAASPTTAPPLAPTPARLATPTTAPLANAAGARSLMDVRFAAGPANN
ncbi:MAG: DUF4388 domain-containing protein, partial [Chloroflexi bacterium]